MAMKKRKITSNGEGSSSSSIDSNKEKWRPWGSLTNDVLLNIFNRLQQDYLFWMVSEVCRSWQVACWESLFWLKDHDYESLFLGMLAAYCYNYEQKNYDRLCLALPRVFTTIFDGNGDIYKDIPVWKSSSFEMVLPLGHMTDNYLIYVAERTPKLQKVSLDLPGITGKGFSRSIRKWRQLEEITLISLSFCHSTHIIQEIGINCRNLEILNVYSCIDFDCRQFCVDGYSSQLISDSLCSLRKLWIYDCFVSKYGLLLLLSKCKQLEKLCLQTCIRTLEDVRLTRRRGALHARPFKIIPEPLSVSLQRCEGSDSDEWFIDEVPIKLNARSVIDYLYGLKLGMHQLA